MRRDLWLTAALLVASATCVRAQCPDGTPPPCASRRAVRADDRIGLAVFPFRANTAAEAEWSEAIPDLLTTALDGTPGVRVTDPWALWRSLRPDRSARAESPDPREAAVLARQARAQRFVLGTVARVGARLNINARLYRVGRAEPLVTFGADRDADSLASLVRDVQLRITSEMAVQRDSALRFLDTRATQSPAALKAYLAAREAMRRGLLDSAEAMIDRALALDSTFALAYVEATHIKGSAQWLRGQPYTGLETLAEKALHYGDSLSERFRLRATMTLASIRTRGADCARTGERILELDNTDIAAWHLLAYCHVVYGWQYGRGARDAQAALDRVLRLDSTYAAALPLRVDVAITSGDADDQRRQLRRFRAVDTTGALTHATMAALTAVLAGDAEFPALARRMAGGPANDVPTIFRELRINRPDRAERFLDELDRADPSGRGSALALGARLQLLVAEGRLVQADSLRRARGITDADPLTRRADRMILASAIAGMSDDTTTSRALERLTRYVPAESALALFRSRPVWQTGWVLAAWQAASGDTSVTRSWITAFGTLPHGGPGPDWVRSLQEDLEARIAARGGDTLQALAKARSALEQWGFHANTTFESDPEPGMRLLVATLWRSRGMRDSSEALLASLVSPVTWMGFLSARASLELAALLEARSDRIAAVSRYRRALALWERGGPEVAAWRARAAAGLQRTAGSGN